MAMIENPIDGGKKWVIGCQLPNGEGVFAQEGPGPVSRPPGDNLHIIPTNDLVAHEWSDCACQPKVVLHQTDDGDYWQYSHHALDGRE